MPKFDMEWQYRTSCIVEADSLKAAKEAAQQHVDAGTLHEWANIHDGRSWECYVHELPKSSKNEPDMGVVKNSDGEWEAFNINDARVMKHNDTIRNYYRVRCPKCGTEGTGGRFYRPVYGAFGNETFARIECPNCKASEPGPEPGIFEVAPPVAVDDATLPLFESEGS